MISGTFGPTLRILSGDVSDRGRRLIVSTDRRVLFGGELVVAVQLGNIILDARATALSNFDEPIPGLRGVQLQTGLTFLLPWEVVSGGDRQAEAKAKQDGPLPSRPLPPLSSLPPSPRPGPDSWARARQVSPWVAPAWKIGRTTRRPRPRPPPKAHQTRRRRPRPPPVRPCPQLRVST